MKRKKYLNQPGVRWEIEKQLGEGQTVVIKADGKLHNWKQYEEHKPNWTSAVIMQSIQITFPDIQMTTRGSIYQQ